LKGVDITNCNTSNNTFVIINNVIIGGNQAIQTQNWDNAITTITIANNLLDSGSAVFNSFFNSAYLNAIISANTIISGAVGYGISINLWMNGRCDANISDNIITGIAGSMSGILSQTWQNTVVNYTIINNTISNFTVNGGIEFAAGHNSTSSIKLESNRIYNNINGFMVGNVGSTQPVLIDLGGGALGSRGQNSIYSNTNKDVNNLRAGLAVKAENNWWGTAAPVAGQFNGNVDYTLWLTSNPN